MAQMTSEEFAALTATQMQVGGNHYKNMAIQPVTFIHKNGLGYIEGAVIKYICRWRHKNGIEDLQKAKHFIDLLIELEEESEDEKSQANPD